MALRIYDSRTGLEHATVVQRNGANHKYVKAITRFNVENRMQTSILQSDNETAILFPLSGHGAHIYF
eukprot:2720222-Amphidinium_carterae.1